MIALLNVPPIVAFAYVMNGGRTNAEKSCCTTQGFASGQAATNLSHLLSIELCHGMAFTTGEPFRACAGAMTIPTRIAILGATILHVVGLRTQKQVSGVHASGIVATVKNEQIDRERPICQFVGKAVRPNTLRAIANVAIRVIVARKILPQPAFIGVHPTQNLGPKPFNNRDSRILSGHDLSLLYRLSDCRVAGVLGALAATSLCPNYTIRRG